MYKLLKNRVALLSVLLFFAAPYRSNAQTIGDASIFYRFYNDDSVRVTITFFSKTNSFSAAPLIVTPEKSTPFTVNLTKTSGSFNGSVVIQYSYYATIGLKNFTDCNFTFSWKANNRQINGKGLYLEATLNNCLFRDNKSGRTPEPEMVIGSPCINSCNSISVASNTDWIGLNDSVSYSFVNARLDRDTIYAYPSGYDSSKPMSLATSSTCSGFNLNTQTGMITFMPAKSEWTVVAIKATHWTKDKNGIFQKVGTVMHDEELYMSTCGGNKPPVISGINGGTGTHLDLCYGDTVCFTINAYDEDSMYGEVVDMFDKWNGIPGSTFETTREKNYLKGQFCLDTRYNTTGRLSPHFFTVMATDINSGYLRTQKTFSIKVHGVPLVNAGRDTTICLSGNKLMLKGSLYSLADGSYSTNGTWTTADPNTKGLFNSTTPYFDPSVSGIGNFKLVYSYNNQSQGCYISDTVLIKVLPVAKVNGGNYAAQCAGSMQLKLTGSRKDGIWGANAAGLVTKDSFEVYYFSPSKAGPGKHKLWYTAILKDSCAETDTVIINVLPYSNVKGGTYNAQCVETTDLILGGSHKNGTWNTSSPLLITKDISGIYHFSPNKAGIGLHKLWYSAPFHKDSCPQTDTIFIQVDSNCVWPGDANRDKTADYLDILDIALGYSSTGSPRLNASTNWIPQLSKDWSNSLSSGINYKHLDTNGDSIIDANDTFAVKHNYGKKHLKNEEPQLAGNPNDPPLYFQFDKKYYLAGDTVKAALYVGSADKQVNNIYGLGLKHFFANTYMVNETYNFSWNCEMLCGAKDNFQLYRQFNDNGTGEGSIIRTDKLTTSKPYGKVADVEFILKDSTYSYPSGGTNISIDILKSRLIDINGNEIPVYTKSDAVKVYRTQEDVVGFEENTSERSGHIKIYPNPANSVLNIISSKEKFTEIAVFNALGKTVMTSSEKSTNATLNIQNLSPGIYFVMVKFNNTYSRHKLIISR